MGLQYPVREFALGFVTVYARSGEIQKWAEEQQKVDRYAGMPPLEPWRYFLINERHYRNWPRFKSSDRVILMPTITGAE